MTMKPHVGTPVQYIGPYSRPDEPEVPLAAVITKVFDAVGVDTDGTEYAMVNLVVFDDDTLLPLGTVRRVKNVKFRAPGQVGPSPDFCEFIQPPTIDPVKPGPSWLETEPPVEPLA